MFSFSVVFGPIDCLMESFVRVTTIRLLAVSIPGIRPGMVPSPTEDNVVSALVSGLSFIIFSWATPASPFSLRILLHGPNPLPVAAADTVQGPGASHFVKKKGLVAVFGASLRVLSEYD